MPITTECWSWVLSCVQMLPRRWQIFGCIAAVSWLVPSSSFSSPACQPKQVDQIHIACTWQLVLLHTHTGLPRWARTRKVKPIRILLKQETVSGSGIRWAIYKSAPRSRQITTPAPHHSVFYRPDALPAAQPIVSKHWRPQVQLVLLQAMTYISYLATEWASRLTTNSHAYNPQISSGR